jgi:hypothetical protein
MTLKKYLFPFILALLLQIVVVEAGNPKEAPPMADLVEDPFAEFETGASADLSPKAEIFRDITAHNNKKIQQMLHQPALADTITDRKFVKSMVERAARFNNPQAIDLLLKDYEHHVGAKENRNYHGFVSAQLEAAGAAGVEYGFYNRKAFLEELIKEHPQEKVYIVGYALVGAAEGGHADLVDWILTTQLSVLKARKGFFSYVCDRAMAIAIENYHPEIAVKIGNLHSQGVKINPHLAFGYAYLMRDKESFLFLKKNFPKAYGRFVTEKKKDRI